MVVVLGSVDSVFFVRRYFVFFFRFISYILVVFLSLVVSGFGSWVWFRGLVRVGLDLE